jgi:hypothetical protein
MVSPRTKSGVTGSFSARVSAFTRAVSRIRSGLHCPLAGERLQNNGTSPHKNREQPGQQAAKVLSFGVGWPDSKSV